MVRRGNMKLPTMTKGKHWAGLFALVAAEAVLAFFCFVAGPPVAVLGLVLVGLANVQWVVAVIVGLVNMGKLDSR